MSSVPPTTTLFDPQSLAQLKQRARAGGGALDPAVAGQFEALVLQTLQKSLRSGLPASGLPGAGAAGNLFTELLDQQRALEIRRGRSLGVAALLARPSAAPAAADAPVPGAFPLTGLTPAGFPLSGTPPVGFSLAAVRRGAAASAPPPAALAPPATARAPSARLEPAAVPADKAQFIAEVWPHAVTASQATGIPARFLLAHAALETGWGAKVLKNADGQSSYNAFNIKAGRHWGGPTLEREVREYIAGAPVTERAVFRCYDSYAAAFADYTRLLTQGQRYAAVIGQREASGFARALQQAGFATDHRYADKLVRIIAGPTLRQQVGPLS